MKKEKGILLLSALLLLCCGCGDDNAASDADDESVVYVTESILEGTCIVRASGKHGGAADEVQLAMAENGEPGNPEMLPPEGEGQPPEGQEQPPEGQEPQEPAAPDADVNGRKEPSAPAQPDKNGQGGQNPPSEPSAPSAPSQPEQGGQNPPSEPSAPSAPSQPEQGGQNPPPGQSAPSESSTQGKPAAGASHQHQYDYKVTKEPTCEECGILTYTCSCGDSYTEPVAAYGHDKNTSVMENWYGEGASDCSKEAVREYSCWRCGILLERTVIHAQEHNYGPWVDNGDGSWSRSCSKCTVTSYTYSNPNGSGGSGGGVSGKDLVDALRNGNVTYIPNDNWTLNGVPYSEIKDSLGE